MPLFIMSDFYTTSFCFFLKFTLVYFQPLPDGIVFNDDSPCYELDNA